MRFAVSGIDNESGQYIEMTFDSTDAPSAAELAVNKGINVIGVRPLGASSSNASSASAPTNSEEVKPPSLLPPKQARRYWLMSLLFICGFLFPLRPEITLFAGIALVLILTAYFFIEPMRGKLGNFLRVSSQRPVWRVIKLTTFSMVAIVLMFLAFCGLVGQRAEAELVAKKAAADAAKSRSMTIANSQVQEHVDTAKAALISGNIPKAKEAIDESYKITFASNHRLILELQNKIDQSTDSAWIINALSQLPEDEFEAFKGGGKPPAEFDLGYEVLTEQAVAIARKQMDAVISRRAEQKKQEEAAAEIRRKLAEAQRIQEVATAEAARKAAEERVALEVERRVASQKELRDKLDAFTDLLKIADVTIIKKVHVNRQGDIWTAKMTVKNIWHLKHYQLRLQDAQTLWKAWATIASPKNPDAARISIIDENDNEVGGSRILGGSLIWVQER